MTTPGMRLLGKRFLLLATPTAESRAVAAIDVHKGARCIALFADTAKPDGTHLRLEQEWLQSIHTYAATPSVLAWLEQTDRDPASLVVSTCTAPTLANLVRHERFVRPVSGRQAWIWALALSDALIALPEMTTLVPRLTLDNIVVVSESKVSFQRLAPVPLTADTHPVRQLYGLLYLLLTGMPYSLAAPWTHRSIQSVNPLVSEAFARFIESGVSAASVPSLADFRRHVEALSPENPTGEWAAAIPADKSTFDWHTLAVQAGNHLAATIHNTRRGHSLYEGLAGDVYVLAESVDTLQIEAWRQPLHDAAFALSRDAVSPSGNADSLYSGEAGVALALIRAGEVLNDPTLTTAGFARARRIADMPFHETDLLLGAAGRLRFQVWLWQRTGNSADLQAAETTAQWLLENTFERDDVAGVFWHCRVMPEGAAPFLGYGHGIAGIGDTLLDLYRINGNPALWSVIQRIAATLRDTAIPVLEGRGVNWHKQLGDGVVLDRWCHGTPGIGHFLLNLTEIDPAAWLRDLANQCLYTTAYGSAYLGTCLCHGLAGSIDLLLHGIRTTDDDRAWSHIHRLGALLDDFKDTYPTGISWRDHLLQSGNSALMTGSGGVLLCLLQLLTPHRSRLLI